MKVLSRAIAPLTRLNWRDPEHLLRLGIFLAVLAIAAAAFLLRNQLTLTQVGYGGLALASLVASAAFVIPVPALGAACASSVFLNPLFISLVAGTAESLGELTGYFLGYTGREVVSQTRLYRRLEPWVRRRGWLPLLLVSLVPNPIFDLIGIAAGALRYPLWVFLTVVWVGKTLKYLIIAYACAYSIVWLRGIYGV